MHIKFILVTLVTLVLSIATIPGLSLDLFQDADAIKSAGSDAPGRLAIKSYGSANNKIVCGDRLCSELPSKGTIPQVKATIFSEKYAPQEVELSDSSTIVWLIEKYGIQQATKKISYTLDLSGQHVTEQVTKEYSYPIDFSGQNLYGKSLNHLDLRYADLSYTNLRGVDLEGVDLTGANLQSSFLYNANLDGAILKNADLSNSNLLRAYFRNADLSNANLSDVVLYLADLTSANLTNANLQNANLFRANFASTDLHNADMTGAGTGTTNFNDCMNHPVCKWTNYHTKMNS